MSSVTSIEQIVADGIVDEIVQRVKTGKEAEVYVVRKGEDYLAAKVYKERNQRNFKNNVGYMEGRTVRNSRDMRAMQKRTKYGVDKAEDEWMHTEHDALVTVSHAGVRVPKPELFYEGVLLMELVLGADGQPAPRLIDVPLSREDALAHHHEIVSMIVKMLCCDLIHGDLSPYNILLAWNGPTIIDLPQVVKAAHNSQAEKFLVRDVRNVTEHFARYAPELKTRFLDGHQIWRKYTKRELSPDFFPEEGQSFAPAREFVPPGGGQRRPPRPHHDGAPASPAREVVPGQPRPNKPPRPENRPHPKGPREPRPAAPEHATHRPREPRPHHASQGNPGNHGAHGPQVAHAKPHAPAPHAAHPKPHAGHAKPHAPATPHASHGKPGGGHHAKPTGSAPTPQDRPSRFSQHHRRRG